MSSSPFNPPLQRRFQRCSGRIAAILATIGLETATLEDSGAGDDCVGVRATFAVISGFGAAINFKPDWSIADHFADSADLFRLAFNERLSAESWIDRHQQDEIEIVYHIFEARLMRRALSATR